MKPLTTILVAVTVLSTSHAQSARAQEAHAGIQRDAQENTSHHAPIYLEPGHWVYRALRTLSIAGVAPDASSATFASISIDHARMVFDSARVLAETSGRTALARQAEQYSAALDAEYARNADLLSHLTLRAGVVHSAGEALGGDGYFRGEDFEGARPISGMTEPVAAASGAGYIQPWLSWTVDGGWIAGDPTVIAGALAAAAGPVNVWAGRRTLQYGAGDGGAVVVGTGYSVRDVDQRTRDPFDGFGVELRDPFYLPAFLRVLGPIRIEAEIGRLDRNGRVAKPYVGFGRIVGSPVSRRITLGAARGAIFGGEGNHVTPGRLLGLLVGQYGGVVGEFENQTFSGIARYRAPTGDFPTEFYMEWGMDDEAGSIRDVPGQVFGVDIGPLPSAPGLSFTLEHTRIAHSCCGNTPWYRNVFFRGSWADNGRLFAQALGGNGREIAARATFDAPQNGLFLRAEAFARDRGDENLFAIQREGHSFGGTINAEYRVARRTVVRADAGFQHAESWSENRLSLTASYQLK